VLSSLKNLATRARNHVGFRRYAANTSWMFAEQMLRMVAGLLVGIWVARYLGPEQFGLFSYSMAFAALFSSVAKLGLDSIVVRDLVRDPNLRDVYLGTAFWLKLAGAITMLGVIGIAVQLTSSDSNTKIYVLIIASGAIFQAFEVVDFYFQSKVLSKFVSICKLTQLIISSLIKLYLIHTKSGLFSFVMVSLIDQVTLAATLFIAYRHQKIGGFFRNFDRHFARKLLQESWPLILSGLIVMIYMRIDQIMIKEMLNEKEVGIYSAATRISEVWYFIPILLSNSLFPSIINAKNISIDLYHSRLQKLYTFMFWMAISIALPMTFFSDWIVDFLYGNDYKSAGNVLMIQIWAGVFVFLGVPSSKWFISEGLQKFLTLNTIAGAIINIILNTFLIPKYGIYGAALATVISQSFASYIVNLIFPRTRSNFFRLTKALIFAK
jgi:O-antigen/teichoic acid export membrane protein